MGLFAAALAIGGGVGPLISGMLVQHLGFQGTFYAFAGLAAVGAAVFTKFVPETGPGWLSEETSDRGPAVAGTEAS